MCVGPKALREKFTGIIRETEIDKVDMDASFHAAYYLSTAKNELGVVSAQSAAGGNMVPISWTEMQCPLPGKLREMGLFRTKTTFLDPPIAFLPSKPLFLYR
ncbi:hypothetical protein V2J09_022619 [Rumex salicifolius]